MDDAALREKFAGLVAGGSAAAGERALGLCDRLAAIDDIGELARCFSA